MTLKTSRPSENSTQDPRQPIVAISQSGGVTKANAPARKFLGADEEALEGLNLGALVATYLSQPQRAVRIAKLALPQTGDGERSFSIVVSDDSGGSPVSPPVDNAKSAEVETRERQKLADYIAHELKSPLATIHAMSNLLLRRNGLLGELDRAEALESIQTEAERCLLILDALLRLVQSRRMSKVDLMPVPLDAVLRKVVADHERRNPERAMRLSGESVTYVRADRIGIELAMGNLLNNAEKYAPRGTPIQVCIHRGIESASVLVLNEGAALPSERYQLLWEIYSSGPGPEVAVTGSGVGLSLCKELLESMGGRVWAGPSGQGSAFAISLPIAQETPNDY
jgi:signal transduction histidine kinase